MISPLLISGNLEICEKDFWKKVLMYRYKHKLDDWQVFWHENAPQDLRGICRIDGAKDFEPLARFIKFQKVVKLSEGAGFQAVSVKQQFSLLDADSLMKTLFGQQRRELFVLEDKEHLQIAQSDGLLVVELCC